MIAGEMTEDEARQQPCPFGLYEGQCIASKCRVAWRWAQPKRARFMVTAPGLEETEYSWDPRAYRDYEDHIVRVVLPEITGYCGAIATPSPKPDYGKDVEPPPRTKGGRGS